MRMFTPDGTEVLVDKEQISALEASGWTRKPKVKEEVTEAPSDEQEVAATEAADTEQDESEQDEAPVQKAPVKIKRTPRKK